LQQKGSLFFKTKMSTETKAINVIETKSAWIDPITSDDYLRISIHLATNTRNETTMVNALYCWKNLIRFYDMAFNPSVDLKPKERDVRLVQLGLTLGRLQEMIDPCGGKEIWWQAVEPLLSWEHRNQYYSLVQSRMLLLGFVKEAETNKKTI
jgi:hypothetical protein